MSREKARRWTLYRTAGMYEPVKLREGGPNLEPGESVEVAEVSELQAEWEASLLSDRALDAGARVLASPYSKPINHMTFRRELANHADKMIRVMLQAARENPDEPR